MHFIINRFSKEISSFTFVAFFQGLKGRTLIFQQTIVYILNVKVYTESQSRNVTPLQLEYAIKRVSRDITEYH